MKEKIPEHVRGRIAYLKMVDGKNVSYKDIQKDPMIEYITRTLINENKVIGQGTFWDAEKEDFTTEHDIVVFMKDEREIPSM